MCKAQQLYTTLVEVSSVEKNIEVSTLLDFYAYLLTENQRQALSLYYNEDFSLAEIAESQGITRQGVRDTVQKAQTQLFELEKKLHLVQRFKDVEGKAQVILENVEKMLLTNDFDSIKILAIAIKNAAKSIQKEQ